MAEDGYNLTIAQYGSMISTLMVKTIVCFTSTTRQLQGKIIVRSYVLILLLFIVHCSVPELSEYLSCVQLKITAKHNTTMNI